METGTWSGGHSDHIDEHTDIARVKADATWIRGPHLIKAGVGYKDVRWYLDRQFDTLLRFSDDQYLWFRVEKGGRVGTRLTSAFVQDSWQLASSFWLNAGVRWEMQQIVSSKGTVAQTIPDQWQPRVGVTFEPDTASRQRLFASAGRFYQEVAAYPLSLYFTGVGSWSYVTYDHDPRFDPSGGDTLSIPTTIQEEIDGLEGQYFDEVTVGYERMVTSSAKIGVRGIFRQLGQILDDGYNSATDEWQWNNPGQGVLSAFPKATRIYRALEFSFQSRMGKQASVLASYVLSRTVGNYPGLFNIDSRDGAVPNSGGCYDLVESLEMADGDLPTDRRHVVKLSGSYRVDSGLAFGAIGSWVSGTPLSEFRYYSPDYPAVVFVTPRGTAGRTPDLWDLNFRILYDGLTVDRLQPRVTLDILHALSAREAVDFDQVHYFDADGEGNPIDPNPSYGMPIRYQPPVTVRLGAEILF
jgi:hypothetical protein